MTFRFLKTKEFAQNERGSVAIMFGLSIIVLLVCCGLAIDMGMSLSARTKLANAIDSAALSAAKSARDYNLDKTKTEAIARQYVDGILKDMSGTLAVVQTPDIKVSNDSSQVDIKLTANYITRFGGLVGMSNFTISVDGSAKIDGNDIEVGLQLDVTGSMDSLQGGVSKISALRNAAKDAVDIMIPDTKGPHKVRIGLAPFSSAVNAGSLAQAVTNNVSSSCTQERLDLTLQASDVPPVGVAAIKKAGGCPSSKVVGLTDDKAALKTAISGLTAGGGTAGHLGAAWSWYLVSPNWASIWGGDAPAPYADGKTVKVAIMMTDGDYNNFGGNGGNEVLSQKYALDTCAAMRAKGITIYTVGFGDDIVGTAKDTLVGCATDSTKFFLAKSEAELKAAFTDIARDIISLKLTK
jgi:Flp pilus assembly protein TadG